MWFRVRAGTREVTQTQTAERKFTFIIG
jgi:hypothetical protein